MSKHTVPTEQQKEIMRRNGIDVDSVSVAIRFADDDTIRLLNHDTRDEITIHRGDKPW